MLNKRGADLIIVIIWLVLGILVAVFLIWGFSTNWSMFSSLFGGNNVNIIATQCQTACATSDTYGFCSMQRTLKVTDLPDNEKEKSGSCDDFVGLKNKDGESYGIADCPGLQPC